MDDEKHRIKEALNIAFNYGSTDGDHHKMWVIDQMVRALTGCPIVKVSAISLNEIPYEYETYGESEMYKEWVRKRKDGEDGPDTYAWSEGIPP